MEGRETEGRETDDRRPEAEGVEEGVEGMIARRSALRSSSGTSVSITPTAECKILMRSVAEILALWQVIALHWMSCDMCSSGSVPSRMFTFRWTSIQGEKD